MIIDNKHTKTFTSANLDPVDMGISDNPEDQKHILNALSSSLYTDKIAAVLREYSANGADANVEAGHPEQPIEVTLPNRLQQTLAIRDFGFGMTEGQIKKTFIMLGSSTKRDTRDQTGAFGIGSKAGFAYGDSFMVTSYTGGQKFIYNCYRDNGMPRLALMASEPSNAPDGIEIKVPVRPADIAEFLQKAERVFRYFKVRPIIHGGQIAFERGEQVFSGTGWRFLGNEEVSVVVSGNMGYEIDSSAMGNLTDKEEALLDLGVELDIELTADKIALNREGLQYTDETRKLIVSKLRVVAKEIGKIFHAQVAATTSLWEAHKLYHKLFEKRGGSSQQALRHVVAGAITWKGQVISSGRMEIHNEEKAPGVISITNASRRTWGRGRGPGRHSVYPNAESVLASDATQIILNDLPSKKYSPSRVRGFFANTPANDAFQDVVVFTYIDDKAQEKHWKLRQLAGAPFVYLSTIAPFVSPSKAAAGDYKNNKHSSRAFILDENCRDTGSKIPRSTWWEKAEADLKKGTGVYVQIEKFIVMTDGKEIDPCSLLEQVKRLRAYGLIHGPVYGFKPAYVDRLTDTSKWVRLDVAVQAAMAKLCECKNFLQAGADYVEARDFSSAQIPSPNHTGPQFPEGSLMQKFLVTRKAMLEGLSATNRGLLNYINSGDGQPWLGAPTLPKASVDLEKMEVQVLARYPMFAFGDDWSYARTEQIKRAVEYVAMVELVES